MFIVPSCGTGRVNRFRGDLDKFFGDFLSTGFGTLKESALGSRVPAVKVWEDGDLQSKLAGKFFVEVELPGLTMDDVEVLVMDDTLTIKGEFAEQNVEDATVYRCERRYGSFERAFKLPADIDAEKVEARLRDGLLTITLPKLASAQPRKIKVD